VGARRLTRAASWPPALMAEGIAQGQHERVARLQSVGQDGSHGAWLAQRGGDDERLARAGPVPCREEDAAAGRIGAAGFHASDPVVAQQRVEVADDTGHGNVGRAHCHDRGESGHPHGGSTQSRLVVGSAGGGGIQPGWIGVGGCGHAELAGSGVHPRGERRPAAGVPPRENPGHVVRGRQQQRLQRLALGDGFSGSNRYQRITVADLGGVGRCLLRLDRDERARCAGRQRMVAEDYVGGHHFGDAGDRHRPGSARASHQADAADVRGRLPVRRPGHRAQPLAAAYHRCRQRLRRCCRQLHDDEACQAESGCGEQRQDLRALAAARIRSRRWSCPGTITRPGSLAGACASQRAGWLP
jgi:hypothetical protein